MTSLQRTAGPAGISDIKEAVGSLFFVWASVENALFNSIDALDGKEDRLKTRGILQSLKLFRDLHLNAAKGRRAHIDLTNEVFHFLTNALEDRNLIAHGVRGLQANLENKPEKAYMILELGERKKVLTLEQLRTSIEKLNSIASHMSRMDSAALQPDMIGISNIYLEISGYLRRR